MELDWNYVFGQLWLLVATAVGSAGFYQWVMSLVTRNRAKTEALRKVAESDAALAKIKAETENVTTATYREVVIMLRAELVALQNKYNNVYKEFTKFKTRSIHERAEENQRCDKKIALLTARIVELERELKSKPNDEG